ncbi:MAG: glycosyltransferase family 2 protein [Rickettsiales bacterium]|jgi:glycosyltransferase involved in cell wall biosynthesis|nr:glycosyltransferase family 2 protein [Rickettsiales bacterium]
MIFYANKKEQNNSMDKIKISAVIPIYNAEKYLERCINSVINQNIEKEIICIDDGSTDNTRHILNDICQKNKMIKVVFQKNKGAGFARNVGLKEAQGEYIHFLDSDDYLHSAYIYKAAYDNARSNALDIIRCKTFTIDDKTGEEIYSKRNLQEWLDNDAFNRVINFQENPIVFVKSCPAPWCGLFRTEFLKQNNIEFNGLKCVNDRSFWVHSFIKADRVMFVKDYLIVHRSNIEGSLVSMRAKHFECQFLSYNIISKIIAGLDKDLRKIILLEELHDIGVWYKKFQDSEFIREIKRHMKIFLNKTSIPKLNKGNSFYYVLQNFKGFKERDIRFIEKIFSVRNEDAHKVIRIAGLKIKIRRKYKQPNGKNDA